MIVTITANPSLDRTIQVRKLVRGGLHRASSIHVDPGGKGINVARALVLNGLPVRAVVAAGGVEGEQLISLLELSELDVVPVPAVGPVRINVSVVEPDATVTKFNEPGALLGSAEAKALSETVLRHSADARWVVIAGSLPPGAAIDFYGELVRAIGDSAASVVVDTSGPALRPAVAAGPALVKPNLSELEEAVGRRLDTLGDVVAAGRELVDLGAGAVLASLGRDGAVLLSGQNCWHAEAPAVVGNSVGAGDALLAGFLAAGGAGLRALVTAVAWGSAAASLPGSTMPGPEHLHPRLVLVAPELEQDRKLHRDS
ncbi:1-phosphofructokinase family hexose kinase [Amycolatopsis nigrescens]|uniref:1-phosphofructokinase family hexose kinase n=1 Tax=Amycolatopsis nigrescens TaxID=381445 RepID=UPI000382CBA9|nr:1-phosphofructokinase family hexose kinase [Amycolatopsis nigrescens]